MIVGTLTDDILRAANRLNDPKVRERVIRRLRFHLLETARMASFSELRAKTTIDFTSDDYSTGMLLPSDLLGIDMVRDTDGYEFFERNRSDIEPDEYGYRFYRYHPSQTGLLTGTDVSVTNEGTSFTSDSLDDAGLSPSGEYVRFGEGLDYFLISTNNSPYTISPTYYGPSITDGDFVVRPPETQRMVILDASEEVLQDRSMDIYYWRAPAGLYRPSDRIPLASCKYLELLVLRDLPEAKERRPVSRGEIKEAKDELMKMNPSFPRSPNPRDKHGNIFAFNTGMYKDRE